MRHLITILLILACNIRVLSAHNIPDFHEKNTTESKACFSAYVDTSDETLADILMEKTKEIIGRIGCGHKDADYLLIPSIHVDETERSSGMIRNVTLIKGSLSLMAVSRKNPATILHSTNIPLEAIVTGNPSDPAIELAKQIKVNDAVYVRFVRVARRKISEELSESPSINRP